VKSAPSFDSLFDLPEKASAQNPAAAQFLVYRPQLGIIQPS
jgi:hypothetical protein